MLPESRTSDEGFALPRFELTPRDVEGFLDELQTFHDHFRSCFSRSEPRGHFFNYGDFSKRISSVIMLRPGGSGYPIWAMQDGAPVGLPPPAWPSCSVSLPFGTPAD